MKMTNFSEKSKLELEYYVYGLIDPFTGKLFYIGKGINDRVFDHEKDLSDKDTKKLQIIAKIKKEGREPIKVIFNWGLTEKEALASEASLINAFNYCHPDLLTNIVSGHDCNEALKVEDFDKQYGAEELQESELNTNVMLIKVNKTYNRNKTEEEIYDITRGIWRANLDRAKKVKYVFAVYHSLIVGVYKPTQWLICEGNEDKMPKHVILDESNKTRIFFIDEDFDNKESKYQYLHKSIESWERFKKTTNPISYYEIE